LSFFPGFAFFRFDGDSQLTHLPLTPAVGQLSELYTYSVRLGLWLREIDLTAKETI
jgi:hypothetical protein